jgi:hypothetical protein
VFSLTGHASIEPVPFHEVEMTSEFWRPRLITQRKVLVPFAFEKTAPGVAHLKAAADFLEGKKVEEHRPHRFIDSDLYKVMEGAAYLAQLQDDPELEAAYPQLFVTNEEITKNRDQARKALKENAHFKKLTDDRAAAYRAQQDHLYENDERLAELKELVENEKAQSKNK